MVNAHLYYQYYKCRILNIYYKVKNLYKAIEFLILKKFALRYNKLVDKFNINSQCRVLISTKDDSEEFIKLKESIIQAKNDGIKKNAIEDVIRKLELRHGFMNKKVYEFIDELYK